MLTFRKGYKKENSNTYFVKYNRSYKKRFAIRFFAPRFLVFLDCLKNGLFLGIFREYFTKREEVEFTPFFTRLYKRVDRNSFESEMVVFSIHT
jgi:hypothetical protein